MDGISQELQKSLIDTTKGVNVLRAVVIQPSILIHCIIASFLSSFGSFSAHLTALYVLMNIKNDKQISWFLWKVFFCFPRHVIFISGKEEIPSRRLIKIDFACLALSYQHFSFIMPQKLTTNCSHLSGFGSWTCTICHVVSSKWQKWGNFEWEEKFTIESHQTLTCDTGEPVARLQTLTLTTRKLSDNLVSCLTIEHLSLSNLWSVMDHNGRK